MNISLQRFVGILAWFALSGAGTFAANLTWTGGGGADSNNWFNGSNWSGGGGNYPQDGDSVAISNGTVVLSNSTAQLANFIISTPTFTFTNWTTALRATNITIQASGGLTHAVCATNAAAWNTNRVYIICSNLNVAGTINVSQLGYRGSPYVAGTSGPAGRGQGPGGSVGGSGGSYGGLGGGTAGNIGPTYGSTNAPSDPGSGGGFAAGNNTGGHGGGAVWIDASGRVVVTGTINADGQGKNGYAYASGGSGGSIYIHCNTFEATNGTLRAQGGGVSLSDSTQTANGGGGGRIAVIYDLDAQHALNLTDRPLLNVWVGADYGYNGTRAGVPGTLYMPDASFFPSANNILRGGQLLMDGFTALGSDSLTITDGVAMFPAVFTLTVTNDLLITGTGGGLQISNAVVSVGRDLTADALTPSTLYGGSRSALTVGRDMVVKQGAFHWYGSATNVSLLSVVRNCIVTNSGNLHLHAGPTNGLAPDYGARLTVGGDMIMASNSWILPYSDSTNGGSVHIEASNVTVQAGSGIDADGKGYGAPRWTNTVKWGYGPGAGYSQGGAGYGGAGGTPGSGSAGGTYGSSNAPAQPGSGGGTYGGYAGGMGGGLVWLNVQQTLTLDGSIRARGNITRSNPYNIDIGGGGSGGGIYIRCRTLTGSASGCILADGGVPYQEKTTASSGGGGGRIAVWRMYDSYAGSNSVAGGFTTNAPRIGLPGTIVWGQIPVAGTVFTIR